MEISVLSKNVYDSFIYAILNKGNNIKKVPLQIYTIFWTIYLIICLAACTDLAIDEINEIGIFGGLFVSLVASIICVSIFVLPPYTPIYYLWSRYVKNDNLSGESKIQEQNTIMAGRSSLFYAYGAIIILSLAVIFMIWVTSIWIGIVFLFGALLIISSGLSPTLYNYLVNVVKYISKLDKYISILSKHISSSIDKFSKTNEIHSTMQEIDMMSGYDFENYMYMVYKNLGYLVEQTPFSGDQGADLIIHTEDGKVAMQVKRYSRNIGNRAIQEVVASKNYYGCTKCAVITNSYFTQHAIDLANCNGVALIDRDGLMKMVS